MNYLCRVIATLLIMWAWLFWNVNSSQIRAEIRANHQKPADAPVSSAAHHFTQEELNALGMIPAN